MTPDTQVTLPLTTPVSPGMGELGNPSQQSELVEKLLAIGTALSSTHDLGELLNLILTKSREITYSDAGSVYLVDRTGDSPKLWFKVAQNDSRSIPFQEFSFPLTDESLAGYVALTGSPLNLPDAYQLPTTVPYRLNRRVDEEFSYRTRSVLVLPMQNMEGETIGVLQLINRKVAPDVEITVENAVTVTQPYSAWEERVLRSLASQAAISIERNQLQESIENLFEGFVRASVQIIEARDPCTSGHSERVAELTVRLGEETNSISTGPLRYYFFDQQQIKEIRYAALLHDFGKVGVPEAILGKQKKLYPAQLDVIYHRFSLARRTLEADCAQNKFRYLVEHPSHQHDQHGESGCDHCNRLKELDQKLEAAIAQLTHYWEVLLTANEPRVLAEEPLAELQQLSHYTYRDIDGEMKPLITSEELSQLLLPKGNLTWEERLSIQSHVTHTYEFLKRIPWTRQLQGVPIIAYGHHEKLDGTGYPQALREEDIPIQSQLMAIADIYDALTASDRPYKKRLPTDIAINILHQEAEGNKVNRELVLLFQQREVFQVVGHTL